MRIQLKVKAVLSFPHCQKIALIAVGALYNLQSQTLRDELAMLIK